MNSATLLLDPDLNRPLHDSLGVLSHLQEIRPDLKDVSLSRAEVTWYTKAVAPSRLVPDMWWAAVATEEEVIWTEAPPPGTSAQRAKLIDS